MNILKAFFEFPISCVKYAYYRHKLSKVDYFDYQELAKYKFEPPLFFNSVFAYGNYAAVARLKKSRFNFLTEYLEHGITFYDNLESARLLGYPNRKTIKRIYTFGDKRKNIIEKYLDSLGMKKTVIAIGPYIKGAMFFHSPEEIKEIKEKYGKILLVYPMHSTVGAKSVYSESDFINEILSVKERDFDSVFMCMYWKDFENHPEFIQSCKQHGFIIVCNGFGGDPQFINRQKELIYLSDMVMTNGLGTHIGYAISMDKPVYYYYQQSEYKVDNNLSQSFADSNRDQIEKMKENVRQLFGNPSFNITQEQTAFIQELWGKWN